MIDKADFPDDRLQLDVLVAVYGLEGIRRLAQSRRPAVDGVRYVVNVQGVKPDTALPPELIREDMAVTFSESMGLSRNRNELLDFAEAPLVMISDDDLDYSADGLRGVIAAFEQWPQSHILTFRHSGEDTAWMTFPDESFNLWHPPIKGFFVTSFDIAMRRCEATAALRFDCRYGIGAQFPQGEEDVFLADARRDCLTARYIPLTVTHHPGVTTYPRLRATKGYLRAKGAVFVRTRPFSWPLRMLTHALRECRQPDMPSRLKYILWWTSGALAALLDRQSRQ